MEDLVYEEFLPKVFIYKNLLPNSKEIAEYAEWFIESKESHFVWSQATEWGVFGQNIAFDRSYVPEVTKYEKEENRHFGVKHSSDFDGMMFDTPEEKEYFDKERDYVRQLAEAFEKSTFHYLEAQGVEREDDWWMSFPAICRYEPTLEENYRGLGANDNPLAMTHHTDYEILKSEMPGDKFLLTCTMYLNDDYEGGGVEFLVDGKAYIYTPKAGDVVVFPSGHPDYFSEEYTYYHGVDAIRSGKKHFVRSFWMKPYEGSEEWLANQKKYGEEVWAEMEIARMAAGIKNHSTLTNVIEIPKPLTFEDVGIDTGKECGFSEFKS